MTEKEQKDKLHKWLEWIGVTVIVLSALVYYFSHA
jgi:hypothetical protein